MWLFTACVLAEDGQAELAGVVGYTTLTYTAKIWLVRPARRRPPIPVLTRHNVKQSVQRVTCHITASVVSTERSFIVKYGKKLICVCQYT